jgi:HK97 family phage major capsid protein
MAGRVTPARISRAATGRIGDTQMGMSTGFTNRMLNSEVAMRTQIGDVSSIHSAHTTLTRTENQKYSLIRAIRQLAGLERDEHSFEFEVSREIERKCGKPTGGLYVPTGMHVSPYSSRALTNTGNAGASVVFTEPQEFIQLLRNAMKVRALGARVLSGLTSPIAFPRQTQPGTLQWTGENPGADVPDADITFDQVTLSPHAAMSSTAYTRQLLQQSSLDVEQIVREDLAMINAVGVDLAAINGLGTGNQPKGILKITGIGSVAIGASGGYPTYATFAQLEAALATQNVVMNTPGFLTTPGVRGYLKQTPIVANYPTMIWGSDNQVYGYRGEYSNQVPSGLTKGSKSDCHAIIFGNWSDLLIGEWGVLELIVDPYRLKKQGVIEVTSFLMVDIGVRYPVSFATCLDARIVP